MKSLNLIIAFSILTKIIFAQDIKIQKKLIGFDKEMEANHKS